ncbi:PH domain-containing protein [Microbacterium sp.]|uniref:PH domain-containing protein n=1 Tax=Microbacterium sp. TaxID=51671 RepID=UPI003C7072C1
MPRREEAGAAAPNSWVIRSTGGVVASVVCAAIAVFLVVDAIARAGWVQALLWVPWLLLVTWAVWVAAASSVVAVDDDGVTVQNLLRRHRLPWRRIIDVEMRMQICFLLDSGIIVRCVGGPALARPGVQVTRMGQQRALAAETEVTGIRQRWTASAMRPTADGPVEHSWDRALVWTFVAFAAAAVVALIVAYA